MGRASVTRRIAADEFAFLRAVLQGMPVGDAAARFLSPGLDLRLAPSELRRLRADLVVAARRAYAFGDARVLPLDMAQLPTVAAQVGVNRAPTLEEFRNQVDPGGGFYSEAELIELYQEQHPPAPISRRAVRALVPRGQLGQALRAQARPESRIVPLERLAVPDALDSSQGANRIDPDRSGAGLHLEAPNDYVAIEAWLSAVAGGNNNTLRAYRREAERLLLWAIFERHRAMSSLTVDDVIAHRTFLSNPAPADRWVGSRTAMRLSPTWRPFAGPLSARSVAQAITIVGSMFDWLVRQRNLALNVFAALPRKAPRSAEAEADPDRLPLDSRRYFTEAQWAYLRSHLDKLDGSAWSARTKFLGPFAYGTWLRLSELVDASVGRLQAHLARDTTRATARQVQLSVLGKGGRIRAMPIVPAQEGRLKCISEPARIADLGAVLARRVKRSATAHWLAFEPGRRYPSECFHNLPRFATGVC